MATKKAEIAPIQQGNETQTINLQQNKIVISQLDRTSIDIKKYREALQNAENVFNPFRADLVAIYRELELDIFINALIGKRTRNITNKNLVFFDRNGTVSEEMSKVIESSWFRSLIKTYMQTIFWGHSLLDIIYDGKISELKLIPRHHVRPEQGIVTVQGTHTNEGIRFREEPISNYTIEINLGLGLFNIAAVNVILKRGGIIDYANFVEIFGSPIREIRYDSAFQNAKTEAENIGKKAGNSAVITIPKDAMELTLHKGADGNSGNLHSTFLKDLKEELAILVLGQTMTTFDGSSLSQSEVHLEEQRQIIEDDKKDLIGFLNEIIVPKFAQLGYPLEGGRFDFDDSETLPLKEQLEIALKVSEKVQIPEEYWYEQFGIPKPFEYTQKKKS